ncbi:MAG: DUF4434 domain-containing protein [Abditibacteriota bacterium]|nr:DUF4434 domain-containing protein [Abditibacteriota bacterium]
MKITGTFLDEISHDIPHQNWGPEEWAKDFDAMRSIGIDEVYLIRCGYKKQTAFPSEVLTREEGCRMPSEDLAELFLTLADRRGMRFFFGTYDSGNYWLSGEYEREVALSKAVCREAYDRYSGHPSFAGWYISNEISRRIPGITELFGDLGGYLKELSGLPVMISPYIHGKKQPGIGEAGQITADEHYREWESIFAAISGYVDIVAFQDGHVDYEELPEFLAANKALGDKYGVECRTNTETFDRDMPIKFLPIKWEKLLCKLKAAEQAGYEKAITFEFSHFMSPNSMYLSAGHLYNRYREYLAKQG